MGRRLTSVLADEYLINDFEEEEVDSGWNGTRKQHSNGSGAASIHYRPTAARHGLTTAVAAAADEYRCSPPPFFTISVTLLELSFFVYYNTLWTSATAASSLSTSGPLPIDSALVFRPDRRSELHRYVLYMLLHAGWLHLMFNLLVQLLVGLPLEMVHGSLRVGTIYMAGVLAGSLGTSVLDPNVYLVGASGGVYALLAAHLANVLLNYRHMDFGALRLLAILLIASVDVGFAVYDRYALAGSVLESPADSLQEQVDNEQLLPSVSYVAHFTGALAGLTIGVVVLKQFEASGVKERMLWWAALGIYASCMIFAVLYNLVRA